MINPIEYRKEPCVLQIPAIVSRFSEILTSPEFIDSTGEGAVASVLGNMLELAGTDKLVDFTYNLRGCFLVVRLSDETRKALVSYNNSFNPNVDVVIASLKEYTDGRPVKSLTKLSRIIEMQDSLNKELSSSNESDTIKVGRRSKTLYLSVVKSIENPLDFRLVIHGGIRATNRVRMYKELLDLMIRENQNKVDAYYTKLDGDDIIDEPDPVQTEVLQEEGHETDTPVNLEAPTQKKGKKSGKTK